MRRNWLAAQLRKRPRPLWMVFSLHLTALVAALLLYALPHHVSPMQQEAIGIRSSRDAVRAMSSTAVPSNRPTHSPDEAAMLGRPADPGASVTPAPTATPTPAPTDGVGEFRIKFADKFTSGAVETTANSYKSANISVSFSTVRYGEANVNVADIYVADISNFITVFGRDKYYSGTRYSEMVTDYAARCNGIATLSGDYYGARDGGVVIRNGTLYRDNKLTRDVCVLYWDGSVKTFSPSEFNAEAEMVNGAYQCWNFGPLLLDENGAPAETFNTDVDGRHPRSIFGYYEPGHYCFIMVDGRSSESRGLSIKDCAAMCAKAGLKQAFNLDGGETAVMAKGTEVYGVPYKGGRKVSDVLMIVDGN